MSGLNQADIAILQHYVDRGERFAYWNYLDAVSLRETGRHSPYAVLAAQVAQGNMLDGVAADRYAAAVAAQLRIAMTPDDWVSLGLNLITADLKFRREGLDLVRRGSGTAPRPQPRRVADAQGRGGTHNRLRISEVLEATSGTVSLAQGGEVFFTPDEASSGAMSFTFENFASAQAANDGIWSLRT